MHKKTLFSFANVLYAHSNNLKVKIANGPASIQCRKLHGLAAIESGSPTKFSDYDSFSFCDCLMWSSVEWFFRSQEITYFSSNSILYLTKSFLKLATKVIQPSLEEGEERRREEAKRQR